MNCVNHPDAAVAAYCQNCGKALCAACVRSVSGVIYCEQCLAAKLGMGGAAGYTPVDPAAASRAPAGFAPGVYAAGVVPPPVSGPNPSTATVLGFIPGVGAMYNGQYVKALVHVLVFVILVGITDNHGIFGIFIAAWIAYQVFDANQTAKARRDGLPLPDPFGLNELGSRLGIANAQVQVPFTQTYPQGSVPPAPPAPAAGFTDPYGGYGTPPASPYAPYSAVPPPAGAGPGYAPGNTPGYVPPAGASPYGMPPYTPVTPAEPGVPPAPPVRREPIGAIVLIGLGLLFLFNTLGIFSFHWIGHLWPLFIIGLGAWLLIRRAGGNVRFIGRVGKAQDPPPPPAGGAL